MTATNVPALTEAQWQERVVELAGWRGWRVFHAYDSRRSAPGWPDIAAVRRGRLLLVELKAQHGRVSADQQAWLADLSAVPGVEVAVWRPSDWPAVQLVLQ